VIVEVVVAIATVVVETGIIGIGELAVAGGSGEDGTVNALIVLVLVLVLVLAGVNAAAGAEARAVTLIGVESGRVREPRRFGFND
jgi:hypothetical protein